MTDSPELAGQKLLDMLPDGCELETTVAIDGPEWKATARIVNPNDTPRPCYVGRGQSEEEALRRALHLCASYWASRYRNRGSNC